MVSESATRRLDPGLLDPVYERLAERVVAGHVPAAALAVGDAEGPIRSETFGRAGRRPVEPHSYFFLASVSKPIFATAMMQLVEEGLLDLQRPVAAYLPEFDTPERRRVTTWHLLTHTSGLPDISSELIRRERPSLHKMTSLALEATPEFEPGSRWAYCTATYYVMGEMIRRLSGLDYREFLRERLFEPLGMQTTFDPRGRKRPIVPVKGVGADSRLRRYLLLRYVASIAPPGGGLFGTLEDLLTFGAALLRPRLAGGRPVPLRPETIELMWQDHTEGRLWGSVEGVERAVHFGLGWHKPTLMDERPGSPRTVAHGGATGTSLWIDPEAELVFVYFTNQWDPDRSPQLEALSGVYEALAGAHRGVVRE